METAGTALRDLVKDDSADAILRRKMIGVHLEFGDILKHCGIRVLAMRKRGRRSIRKNVAIRQVAIDRHVLARIRRALVSANGAAGAWQQDHEVLPILRDLRQLRHRLVEYSVVLCSLVSVCNSATSVVTVTCCVAEPTFNWALTVVKPTSRLMGPRTSFSKPSFVNVS